MASWSFHSSGTLQFGRGSLDRLPVILESLKAHRALIITDSVLRKAGLVDRVVSYLPKIETQLFDAITPEPPEETILLALEAAKRYEPTTIIGLGGGSNMDAAKLVAMCLTHGGAPSDYTGDCRVPGPIVPLVCIPTTSGTGSEVSAAAVFTDAKNKIKVSCLSPFLRPAAAIVDPYLTDGCPRQVTADSGIDALTHAIEAYCAVDHDEFVNRPPGGETVYQGKNPIADAMAERCIRLVAKYLVRAVENGNDREARDNMALAASLGGLAFANAGVALVHAMEYPVGGAVHISHGAGNGLLLPYVMRFNATARSDAMKQIAALFDTADAIEAVERLREKIGVPTRLRDIGVKRELLPEFADRAFAIKRLMRVNPRMPTRDDILSIYQSAW